MCSYFNQVKRELKKEARKSGEPVPHDWEIPEVIRERWRVIRPTVEAETVTAEGSEMRLWGLVPFWSKEPKLKYSTFNARSESLKEKPTFRDGWKRSQRCLIPAACYSEWFPIEGKKVRHEVHYHDWSEMMIAGLWSDWQREDQSKATFTMVTTSALDAIQWLHVRSPLILKPEDHDRWLTASPDECEELLKPQNNIEALAVSVAEQS